ncbi:MULTISPECIES: chromosome segregation protein SMC [unclassified Polynucleobacter]|uniref:chromosome segregation protein SMC n=1 Tax=unclassified Polynucleobacter TaxID=2640945 RepID=UPI000BCFBADB|nr:MULTISPECIES: chromosome segregation protein SMC [unclassified Polynucleobacter]OYY20568.1 MAG: chromosome segregation protein SMC [Polynucleobacter sp. 35-46-11]OZA78624.1 MAG: chromosome segregation protein SMC [Polynucleobacter sp. 39-46-10]
MQLKSIKLSGFKSFVDPTHFEMPGQLIGVVGPNGCGKSNIIDAVRWVLGESRASELRGESMQDVIFNGSGLRKPSGRASVELIFDNSEGRAQSQWSAFTELGIKRVLTRDGNSSYYVNNQVVRRKDIQDIFLGTGMGPRGYAIIGQGTINRILEAKPEELRVFLEEAAGVSKYKERRKETASRLEDTKENLVRVEDILRELDQQLTRLEKQATVAERHAELSTEMKSQQQLLWFVRQTEAGKEQERHANGIRDTQVSLEEQTAKMRHAETELETMRTEQYALQDKVSQAQGDLYQTNADVSQVESQIRYVQEARQRLQQQSQDLLAQLQRWTVQETDAAQAQRTAEQELSLAAEKEQTLIADLSGLQEQMPAREEAYQVHARELNDARENLATIDQRLASLGERVKAITTQVEELKGRDTRLEAELTGMRRPDAEALQMAIDRHAMAQRKVDEARQKAGEAQQRVPAADEARNTAQQQIQSANQELAQTEAKLTALTALQASVQAQGKIGPWLESKGLKESKRLWQELKVESGWEAALESVLRERLAAVTAKSVQETLALANDAPPSRLAILLTEDISPAHTTVPADFTPLLTRVQSAGAPRVAAVLQEWLDNIYIANSLEDALHRREKLPAGGAFVTQQGHLVSRVGVQLYAADSEQAGMLARAQEMEGLEKQLRAQKLIQSELQGELDQCAANYQAAHQAAEQTRIAAEQAVQEVHGFEVERMQLTQAEEKYSQRAEQIQGELSELRQQMEQLTQTQEQSAEEFAQSEESKQGLQENLTIAQEKLELATQERDRLREALRSSEMSAQEAAFATRSLQQRIADLQRDQSTARVQIMEIQDKQATSEQELETLSDEEAQDKLQGLLLARSAREAALANARTEQDALLHQLREADEVRLQIERSLQPMRDKVVDLQLREQAARLNFEQFATLLSDAEADLTALEASFSPDLKVGALQTEVNRLNSEIQSLGPVNMAALDELSSSRERKQFLDAQSADLNEAMQTLTDAIAKIDAETRDLLQGTFDQVNTHFGKLFPELFGGGHAELVMTGEEILDAGVQVMAQPPGKKNSSIYLLSGGEKALTAIALVFSLFLLNPAPFCLLDEVDAPLDDANTLRYAQMVAKMSNKTQFVFISHNKITMEIAHQLIGVTMQEQGVSRIVAVDISSAVSMVEAA